MIICFKDCLLYQNSFLRIPKSQPVYVSYMFLNFFCILSLMFLKSMFFKIKTRVNVYCLQFFEPGRAKIVCFTDMASTILSEQWYKYREELLLQPQI